jgi:dTDP-4-amino-4,6-dideoxygalactose transaminase
MMNIPFVDLKAQYKNIKAEIDGALQAVMEQTAFIGGNNNQFVKKFEIEFANYIGVKHIMSCANGTDSLEILLKALGIGEGDEVIVPAMTWISTAEAVSAIGARPIFVDINPIFYTIDINKIEAVITSKTKAIIPVHLYGQAADMNAIMNIATKHNLKVIEDCAQSHGAMIGSKMVGTFGHAASFSFYPGKNLGAYGDAGCMATNDDALAETCRMIANHGQAGKHNHLLEGRNSRLDGIHAAVLSAKLSHLNDWTINRIAHAKQYDELLKVEKVVVPVKRENAKHVYHLYVLQVDNRNELSKKLKDVGIETAIHYPVSLPFLPCYAHFNHTEKDFPVAAKFQEKIISIPMYAELTNEQIVFIAEQINQLA